MSEPVIPLAVVAPEPIKFSTENPPKSKEDWQKLSGEDPKLWMDLTQQNMDRVVRESRETKEQLERERQQTQNLSLELNRFKTVQPVVQPDPNVKQPYSTNNYPKDQQEWVIFREPYFCQ